MKKRVVYLLVAALSISVLSGCSILESAKKEAIEQMEFTKEHNAGGEYYDEELADSVLDVLKEENVDDSNGETDVLICVVGEEVEFNSGLRIMVTDWGSLYDSTYNRNFLYFDVEITNSGSESFTFSPSSFSVYADNHAMEINYILPDAMATLITIDPERMAGGRVYADVDPNRVYNLELQIGNVIWALQGEKLSQVNANNSVDIKVPEDMKYDTLPIENIAGYYEDLEGISSLSCNMYSSPEGNIVGNITIYLEGACYVSDGELIKISDNIYAVSNTYNEEIVIGFYTNDNGVNAVLYIDGYYIDEFVMQSEYVS